MPTSLRILKESCHVGGDGDGRFLATHVAIQVLRQTLLHGARILTFPALHNHGAKKGGDVMPVSRGTPHLGAYRVEPGG
jgi:hypothetical protein